MRFIFHLNNTSSFFLQFIEVTFVEKKTKHTQQNWIFDSHTKTRQKKKYYKIKRPQRSTKFQFLMENDATIRIHRTYCLGNTFGINRTGEIGWHDWNHHRFSFSFTSITLTIYLCVKHFVCCSIPFRYE